MEKNKLKELELQHGRGSADDDGKSRPRVWIDQLRMDAEVLRYLWNSEEALRAKEAWNS